MQVQTLLLTLVLALVLHVASSENSTEPGPPELTIGEKCERHNGSCSDCVGESSECIYCTKNDLCFYRPTKNVGPDERCGSLNDMKRLTCLVSSKTAYIIIGSVAGVLIMVILICCCYCCRRRTKSNNISDWVKWEKNRAERTTWREEQRKERQGRMDDIRKKYGLDERSPPGKYDRNITKYDR